MCMLTHPIIVHYDVQTVETVQHCDAHAQCHLAIAMVYKTYEQYLSQLNLPPFHSQLPFSSYITRLYSYIVCNTLNSRSCARSFCMCGATYSMLAKFHCEKSLQTNQLTFYGRMSCNIKWQLEWSIHMQLQSSWTVQARSYKVATLSETISTIWFHSGPELQKS